MRLLLVLIASLLFAMTAYAQRVPEGIHQYRRGPASMCGMKGADVADLANKVRSSKEFSRFREFETNRFELYASRERMTFWVLTKPAQPVHPAITCNEYSQRADGTWDQKRTLSCDASREACDRLYREFEALDKKVRQSLERQSAR
ncbi:MAG: hypothetical protein AB7O39_01760 [Flavobacteriaceae bacterium]